MKIGRYRQELGLPVRGSDPAVALRLMGEEQAHRQWGTVVRGHSPDHLRARLAGGRNEQPPVFRGGLQAEGSQVYLHGEIKESLAGLSLQWIFGSFAILLGLIAIALLASASFTNPGLYICSFFGTAFGLLASSLARMRATSFALSANRLTDRLKSLGQSTI